MTLLSIVRNLVTKLTAPAANEAEAMVSIKALYVEKMLALPQGDHVEFLRSLNRSHSVADLWALRTEFYSATSRNFGELQAMRDMELLQAEFQPFIDRKIIKGVETRTSSAPSTLSSRGGPNSRPHSKPSSVSPKRDLSHGVASRSNAYIESTTDGLRMSSLSHNTPPNLTQAWAKTSYL
jgi:hypothetical protein